MDFTVVAAHSPGDGSGIYTHKGERGVIHSNSPGFVKLLLSICHHKSHFDLACLELLAMPNLASLTSTGGREKLKGLSRTHRISETTLPRQRREKADTLGLESRGGGNNNRLGNDDSKHTPSVFHEPAPASPSFATL